MSFRRFLLAFIASILILLPIATVHAAPSLNLGSTASYSLTGKVEASQTCSANPASYEPQACQGAIYTPPYTTQVRIFDDSQCQSVYNVSYPIHCRFDPTWITLPQGSTVVWRNKGNQTHSVVTNQTGNGGLPLFDSGPIQAKGTFSFVFADVGTYNYYDSMHGLTGVVNITPPVSAIAAPAPTSFQLGFSGTIGWNVEGLSSSQANLVVSHNLAVSASPFITFTPVTESGSYEQSVNLSTREESPSTASSLVISALSSVLPALSGIASRTGGSGLGYEPMLTGLYSETSYTEWWVNGPLSNGSPVKILQGWGSVTGSENTVVGGSIGTRQAWIVTSQLSQTLNLNIPNINNALGPSSRSTANANLDLLWSFDKSADLLLRSNSTFNLLVHSQAPTTVYNGANPVNVSVRHDMTVALTLTMQLSSTSLGLSGGQQSPLLNTLASMSWMSLGIAGITAGVISGLLLWLGRRAKHNTVPFPSPLS